MASPKKLVDLAQRTLRLCQVPSVLRDEGALADVVEAWAQERFSRAHVRRVSHSMVLGALDDPRPTVALIGHLDTVPGHPEDGAPRIEGDRLYGLGASDMKGGLSVMMALAEALPRDTLPVNLLFIFYEREEGGYAESGLAPLFTKYPELASVKFGIAMEPTDGVVQVGCVGTLHATLTFVGKSAHSARPWQGKNAIHEAGPLIAELLQREPHKVMCEGYPFLEVLSITTAQGGRARNVIPDRFELNLNYRFAPGKSVDEAQEDVRRLVAGGAQVEFTDVSPSGRVCADNSFFQRLIAATEHPAEPKQAWTDVARFALHGVDAVNFGPGETAQAHQANESCSIAALRKAFDTLVGFLTSGDAPGARPSAAASPQS
jgi:succinyl-diaminopimelate desuccinylase